MYVFHLVMWLALASGSNVVCDWLLLSGEVQLSAWWLYIVYCAPVQVVDKVNNLCRKLSVCVI